MNKVPKWLFLFLSFPIFLSAQSDNIWKEDPIIQLSGFIDVFYVFDFNEPQFNNRQSFLFNHNRHNEVNLNLGLIQLALEHKKYRANLALQSGTYAEDNYAAETGLLKTIFEANVGISLNKRNDIWLDVGIFPSHLGFESAISMENMTLTRSLAAENSPYFLSGAKLISTGLEKWEFSCVIANGWQRIQRQWGNSLPSFGTQVKYAPTTNMTFNWSTFIGTDDADDSRRMRYFNNLYGQFQPTNRLDLIAGFDIGVQQESISSSRYEMWFVPTIIAQVSIHQNWKMACRAEYFQDKNKVIVDVPHMNGFNTSAFSINVDYSPAPAISCRLEGRLMISDDELFETRDMRSTNNFILGASMAVKLDRQL